MRAGRATDRLGDRGAAVAEFVMISTLLVFLLFGVLQVALLCYARTIIAASAADGARYEASLGAPVGSGADRAHAEVLAAIPGSSGRAIVCTSSSATDQATGLPTTVVRCRGHIESIFLPVGPLIDVDVSARALTETVP